MSEEPPMKKHKPNGAAGPQYRDFEYKNDFDTNGLCYFLGTERGTAEWHNPASRGYITVTSKSVAGDSQPLSAVVGRSSVRCVTLNRRDQWMAIDFGDISIVPTRYTLRHYSSWDKEALRNWVLQGSNTGERWVPIRTHTNDTGLHGMGSTHTWDLPGVVSGYSKFRLLQTGLNSNRHHFLACSGFEIYGRAYLPHAGLGVQLDDNASSADLEAQLEALNAIQPTEEDRKVQADKIRELHQRELEEIIKKHEARLVEKLAAYQQNIDAELADFAARKATIEKRIAKAKIRERADKEQKWKCPTPGCGTLVSMKHAACPECHTPRPKDMDSLHDEIKQKEEMLAEIEDQSLCQICLDKKRDTAILPCGHFLYCGECLSHGGLRKCPNCRTPIARTQKIFA